MPTTEEILAEAEKIGKMLSDHPAVQKYKDAQRAVAADPDASRLLAEFDRQIETLGRQEQQGMAVTDAQRRQLEMLQGQIISHLKIKALNMAQVDFVDLLRRINQTIQRPLADVAPAPGSAATPRSGNGGN